MVMRAAAAPYPGEHMHESGAAVPGHVPDPAPVRQDVNEEAERACAATTKAGEPCKGRPGDDGRCAAHKEP
jgi:hypothetical protein